MRLKIVDVAGAKNHERLGVGQHSSAVSILLPYPATPGSIPNVLEE